VSWTSQSIAKYIGKKTFFNTDEKADEGWSDITNGAEVTNLEISTARSDLYFLKCRRHFFGGVANKIIT
jgi:hypothetical protein